MSRHLFSSLEFFFWRLVLVFRYLSPLSVPERSGFVGCSSTPPPTHATHPKCCNRFVPFPLPSHIAIAYRPQLINNFPVSLVSPYPTNTAFRSVDRRSFQIRPRQSEGGSSDLLCFAVHCASQGHSVSTYNPTIARTFGPHPLDRNLSLPPRRAVLPENPIIPHCYPMTRYGSTIPNFNLLSRCIASVRPLPYVDLAARVALTGLPQRCLRRL